MPEHATRAQPAREAARVVALASDQGHRFSKIAQAQVRLLAGHGVQGDAHGGTTVQHRSRVARDPSQPNLRQVHLLPAELFDELAARSIDVAAGQLGENVTTRGLDLLSLPTGTRLMLGAEAVIELTGLRNPCHQIEDFKPGLLAAVLGRDAQGRVIRKAGVMAIVLQGGLVSVGDPILVTLPGQAHRALEVV